MKPSFALHLTHDSIGLLHRTSRGWLEVGTVAVDTPDLPEALGYLRGSAIGLEPSGITTKLVIPNSEILYTTVSAPGPDNATRRGQIRKALDGLTPYEVKDLVFDWRGTGKTVQVAVVARETLREAEEFARQHRFNPLSFVAIPGPGQFGAEPWFGASALAPTLLGPGEKVERDQDPIQIIARDVPRSAPEPAPPAVAEPERNPEPAPVSAETAVIAADIPPVPADIVAEPAAEPASPAAPPAPVAEVEPAPAAVLPEPEPEAPAVSAASAAAPAWQPPPLPPEWAPEPQPEIAAAPVPEPASLPEPLPEVVPAAVVAAEIPAADPVTPRSSDPVADTPPEIAGPEAPKAARALRDQPGTGPGLGAAAPAVERLKAKLAEKAAESPSFGTRRASDGSAPAFGGSRPPVGPATSNAGRPPKLSARATADEAPPTASRPAVAAKPAQAKAGLARAAASMVTSPTIPLPRGRKPAAPPQPEPPAPAEAPAEGPGRKTRTEAEAMTVFGARQPQRGKPRYLGLILTGILLLFLAIVAAWSSYFLASGDSSEEVPAVAVQEPDSVDPPAETAAADPAAVGADPADMEPAIDDEMLADLQDPADFAEPEAVAEVEAAAEPAAEPVAVLPTAEPVTAADETAAEEETGAAALPTVAPAAEPAAPATEAAAIEQPEAVADVTRNPTVEPQDEIFLAMVDPRVSTSDAIALAVPGTSTDAPPAAQPAPPPFGTFYEFDANGLIIPTQEGIITPEGVRLVAGRPSKVPPERPAALAELAPQTVAAPSATQPPDADPATAALIQPPTDAAADPAAQTIYADPALAGARPRARPADLVPAPQQADDDAALTGPSEVRLTSLRPRLRPAEILAAGEAAQEAEEAAAVQAAAASLAATAVADASVSPLAIAVSRKPAPRPKDFTKAVEAAVAAAIRVPDTPVIEEEPQPVARVEPAPEPEPAPAPEPPPPQKPVAKPKQAEPPPTEFTNEIDEPDVVASAPSRASGGTVAKQATFKRAINLSKTNLIGVYGTSSNRYALVRQPNGRYVKVEVGDRIDGGKVAAISDKELRYVKNGRTLTLALPKG